MRATFLVTAGALVSIASTAAAKIDGVVTERSVTYNTPVCEAVVPVSCGSGGGPVGNSATQLGDGTLYSFANYQVSAAITATDIAFGANTTAQGFHASATARTSVAVTFTNDGVNAVTPTLHSSITPGGFGIYVANPSLGSSSRIYEGPENINESPQQNGYGFNDFSPSDPFATSHRLAGASFKFTVSADGQVVASYTGEVTLDGNVTNGVAPTLAYHLDGLATSLQNFAKVTADSNAGAYGFQWDATDFVVALGGLLQPGDSRTLIYSSEVTAFTSGAGTVSPTSEELQAFVGFGDPIGRGTGGGSAVVSPFAAAIDAPAGSNPVGGLTFSRFAIGLPTFDTNTGDVGLPVSTDPLPSLPLTHNVAAVPEPATWAMLLAGLGALGVVMRRRRPGHNLRRAAI